MSVYKPRNSPHWHYDFVYQKKRFYGSTLQTSKARAESVERARRLEAAMGAGNRPQVATLDEACAAWYAFKGTDLKSAPDAWARITLCLKLLGKGTLVTDVTTARIEEAIIRRRGMLVHGKKVPANATVNRDVIDTLRPILKRAVKLAAPGTLFPAIDWTELRLAEPKSKPKSFSTAERGKLLAALDECWHDFARFQWRYGPRLAEMFFQPEDVGDGASTVLLQERKGGDDHIIPILPADRPMLAARVSRAKAAGLPSVWYRDRKGRIEPLTYRMALRAFMQAMTDSGLRASKGARGSHALRHHAAMDVLGATGNLRAAQKLLGHASVQSTTVYAHALIDDVRAALETASSRPAPEEPEIAETETVAPTGKIA